mgnify:CR=1 FL=1
MIELLPPIIDVEFDVGLLLQPAITPNPTAMSITPSSITARGRVGRPTLIDPPVIVVEGFGKNTVASVGGTELRSYVGVVSTKGILVDSLNFSKWKFLAAESVEASALLCSGVSPLFCSSPFHLSS